MIPVAEPWRSKRWMAAHYEVSVRTIERWDLPFQWKGRSKRYRVSECERELARRVAGGGVGLPGNVVELRPSKKGAA